METIISFVMIMQLGGAYFIGQNEFASKADCERQAKQVTTNILAQYQCIPNHAAVKDDSNKIYQDEPESSGDPFKKFGQRYEPK